MHFVLKTTAQPSNQVTVFVSRDVSQPIRREQLQQVLQGVFLEKPCSTLKANTYYWSLNFNSELKHVLKTRTSVGVQSPIRDYTCLLLES